MISEVGAVLVVGGLDEGCEEPGLAVRLAMKGSELADQVFN